MKLILLGDIVSEHFSDVNKISFRAIVFLINFEQCFLSLQLNACSYHRIDVQLSPFQSEFIFDSRMFSR